MGQNLYRGEKIGEFLVRIHAITRKEMDIVLDIQKKNPQKLFGEIAVEMGFINDHAIDQYLAAKFDT